MQIGLGAFIRFANASEKARPRVARTIAEQIRSEYDPATDFWRPMRQAINRDRKTTRDGAALRQLVHSSPARRRPSFEEIANHWGDVSPRWHGAERASSSAGIVDLGALEVRPNPLFSESWDDGHIEAAHVWFNKEELKFETIQVVQRVLSLDGHADFVAPVFVDARRGTAVPAGETQDVTDRWLEELALQFRDMTS